jgi:hypothetical protein
VLANPGWTRKGPASHGSNRPGPGADDVASRFLIGGSGVLALLELRCEPGQHDVISSPEATSVLMLLPPLCQPAANTLVIAAIRMSVPRTRVMPRLRRFYLPAR